MEERTAAQSKPLEWTCQALSFRKDGRDKGMGKIDAFVWDSSYFFAHAVHRKMAGEAEREWVSVEKMNSSKLNTAT
jgi:hypothetical protein